MEDTNMPNRQMKINIADLPNLACEQCGSILFKHETFVVKKVSKLVSPNGEEGMLPVGPFFSCAKCGHINREFLPINEVASPDPEPTPEPRKPRFTVIK